MVWEILSTAFTYAANLTGTSISISQHESFLLGPYSLVGSAAHTVMHIGPLGPSLKCRFYFSRSPVGPEILHFPMALSSCCCLWTTLECKTKLRDNVLLQSYMTSRSLISSTVWESHRKHKFGKEAGNEKCNLMRLIVNIRAVFKWVASW